MSWASETKCQLAHLACESVGHGTRYAAAQAAEDAANRRMRGAFWLTPQPTGWLTPGIMKMTAVLRFWRAKGMMHSAGSAATTAAGGTAREWAQAVLGHQQPLGLHSCCHELPAGWPYWQPEEHGLAGVL